MSTPNLDQRYGRTPSRRRLTRILAIAGAALGTVTVIAWAAWAGVLQPKPTIESVNISYDIVSEHEVVIRFSVSMPPGESALCAAAAKTERQAVVGWAIVDVPPAEAHTRTLEQRLVTSEPAVLGLITECALT